jgi:hypothetical protein
VNEIKNEDHDWKSSSRSEEKSQSESGGQEQSPVSLNERQREILSLVEGGEISFAEGRLMWHVERSSLANFELTKSRILKAFDTKLREVYAKYLSTRMEESLQISEAERSQISQDDIRSFLDDLVARHRTNKERLALSLSKSLSPSVIFKREYILEKKWLPPSLLRIFQETKRTEVIESIQEIEKDVVCLISLLDAFNCGLVRSASDPNNKEILDYVGKDLGKRKGFEDALFELMNTATLQEQLDNGVSQNYPTETLRSSTNFPVYAVMTEKDDIDDARLKLQAAYGDTVFLLFRPKLLGRSTFTPGDSTNVGLLDSETQTIWDSFRILQNSNPNVDRDDLWKDCKQNLQEIYPGLEFSLKESNDVEIRPIPNTKPFPRVLMAPEEAISANALINALKSCKLLMPHEYVETQSFGGVSLEDSRNFKVYINKRAQPLWDLILEHLESHSHSDDAIKKLFQKIQRASISFFCSK